MGDGVWAVIEHDRGRVEKVSFELLCEGLRLAKSLNAGLSAVLAGAGADRVAVEVGLYGADKIYLVSSERFSSFEPNSYVDLLEELIVRRKPELVLFGATLRGKAAAPALAARLDAGLVANCNFIDAQADGSLIASKFIYGGKFSAKYRVAKRPMIITFVPGALGYEKPSRAKAPEIIEIGPNLEMSGARPAVVGEEEADPETTDLRDSEVIIDAGRGVGKEEDFNRLKELASMLGASVGGTRAAVDNKWLPYEKQIGQTGRIVAPRVLICCGVSGAIHHLDGIRDAGFVVAINKDANAPIFKRADIGIVGDVNQVIPEMGRELGRMISEVGSNG